MYIDYFPKVAIIPKCMDPKHKETRYKYTPLLVTEDVASMKVGLTEYLPHISEQMGMKVSAILQVVETGHIQAFQDDFRLRKPDIQIEVHF